MPPPDKPKDAQNTLLPGQGVVPLPVPNPSLPARTLFPTAPRPPSNSAVPKPSYIVRGRVVAAIPGLNLYDVMVYSMGRISAYCLSTASGSNIFRPTTTQSTTLHAGTEVWVALDPVTNGNGFIIGVAHTSAPLASDSRTIGVYPQTVGLEIDPKDFSAKQLDSRIAEGAGKEFGANFNPGLADVVAGDWATTNFNGGGVGVEAFRVWIGGGPMVGVTFFIDEEMTRVAGTNYELITMAEEYEDTIIARSLVSIRRRVDFPADALEGNPPSTLETRGQPFSGESKFVSYRAQDNVAETATPDVGNLPQRSALIYEYRGIDGTYVLTTAASLTLQKWVGVLMPIEVIQKTDPLGVKDFPSVVANSEAETAIVQFPKPVKEQFERPVFTDGEDLALLTGENISSRPRTEDNPLQGVSSAATLVASIIGWQASRAFMTTGMWKIYTDKMPKFLANEDGTPRPIDEINTDPGAWKRVPKFFVINLNSYGASKRLYIGRAMISITDEGGICMQDAWGSQILMAGGNIYMSAEHSIIRNAGKDNTDLSGRDHNLTAARNIEVFASGGRAAIVAGSQLTLVGGNSGEHGVLIHSKGIGSSMLLNGADDKYAASNGGIVLRTEGGISASAKAMRFVAKDGAIGLKTLGGLFVEAGDMSAAFSQSGMWLQDKAAETAGVLLSPFGCAMPILVVSTNLTTYGMSNMLSNTQTSQYFYASSPVKMLREQVGFMDDPDCSPEADDPIKPGFLASGDYDGTNMLVAASMPEAEWAGRLNYSADSNQLQLTCVWNLNTVSGSLPNPGHAYWTSLGLWQVDRSYINNGDNYNASATTGLTPAPLSSMLRGI